MFLFIPKQELPKMLSNFSRPTAVRYQIPPKARWAAGLFVPYNHHYRHHRIQRKHRKTSDPEANKVWHYKNNTGPGIGNTVPTVSRRASRCSRNGIIIHVFLAPWQKSNIQHREQPANKRRLVTPESSTVQWKSQRDGRHSTAFMGVARGGWDPLDRFKST